MVRVDPYFVEAMADQSGACYFVLRNFSDRSAARRGMEAAQEALFGVPHPEEPEEGGLPKFVSDLLDLPDRMVFWADCKDELDNADVASDVAFAIIVALDAAGTDGELAVGEHGDYFTGED